MEDTFGRNIRYLRLSVTELCDLRCRYCMAEEGVCKRGHEELCSFEELRDFTAAAAALGVTKLRVTGGEPLVRRGIVELCAMLRAVPGIEELCLTTNGTRLEQLAAPLKEAGVDRLNISLDTLRPERYREITRTGKLENVLRGIEAAERAGFENIKLNCVLLGGMNDDEIGDFVRLTAKKPWQVRFIELMPMGVCAAWPPERFLPAREVLSRVPELRPAGRSGVAQLYRLPGAAGTADCRWGALAIRVSSICLSLYTTVSVGWSDACEAEADVSPAVERNAYMASAVSSDVSHCCALRSWSSHCLISSMRCRLSGMTWLMASMAATTVGMR